MMLTTVPAMTKATVPDYVSLFDRSYGGDAKLSAEYLAWQYASNPDGGVIGVDAFDGDTLAAHYAVIPRRFEVGGSEILGALSVNTATHPEYQGKGLFTRLAAETYTAAAAMGVRFVTGVANANSVTGFVRKLGFKDFGAIRLAVGAVPMASPEGGVRTLRSEGWWRWRLQNPSRRYTVARRGGHLVIQTKVRGAAFNIGCVTEQLAVGMARSSGLLTRVALTPVYPTHRTRILLPERFQPSPWRVIVRSLDGAPVEDYSDGLQYWGIDMDTF